MSAEKKDTVTTTEPRRAVQGALMEFSPEIRALYLSHVGLVATCAKNVSGKVGPTVELDDLLASGRIGLLDAAQRFEPERGIPFRAFARIRITGAMFDCARAAGLPRRMRLHVQQFSMDAFDEPWFADGRPAPDQIVLEGEIRELLRSELAGLDHRAIELIERHYFGDEYFDEIAEEIGVSKSYASRIHSSALAKLRERLPRELLA